MVQGTNHCGVAVRRLRTEINELQKKQSEALNSALFVGMTPDEAREYDARRAKILSLRRELEALEASD